MELESKARPALLTPISRGLSRRVLAKSNSGASLVPSDKQSFNTDFDSIDSQLDNLLSNIEALTGGPIAEQGNSNSNNSGSDSPRAARPMRPTRADPRAPGALTLRKGAEAADAIDDILGTIDNLKALLPSSAAPSPAPVSSTNLSDLPDSALEEALEIEFKLDDLNEMLQTLPQVQW